MRKAGIVLTAFLAVSGTTAGQDAAYELDGLEQPAEIIVDEWGIPHIYANTHYDAFFVQGFNAARDRLWQIDTWRRRGLGTLSEVFGEQFVAQDHASRLLLYRGDMYREWLAYGSDAKRIAESFAAGINAYTGLIDEHPELLPMEFSLLNYRPAQWNAADIVRIRSHGISQNVGNEVTRARIACLSDLDTADNWIKLEPDWSTEIPDGLDPCVIPADVLDLFELGRTGVAFRGAAYQASKGSERDWFEGSNNWAVAPSRTTTGRPILANDPHRGHTVPSLRYISHIVAPGMNVIGAGEPALPGISIGHNDRIAFGLTIFPIDQSDLYVYELEGDQYRYGDGTEFFRTVTESIPVRGGESVDVELRFTRHGPVVYQNSTHAFAVRLGFLEPGMAPYFGSVEYMRAGNWRQFVAALNRWGSPSENQVYADTDGNIGYKPAGLFPRRPNWDGLMPVPGDGRYEWDGFYDMDVLPEEYNPDRGFTGTANSMNLPDGYPIDQYKIGFEWSEPWRYDRVWEMLSAQERHTLEDSTALQRDYHADLALMAIERIPASVDGPAADMLRGWDGEVHANSGPAALFMIWLHRHLRPAMQIHLLPDEPESMSQMHFRNVLTLMEDPLNAAIIVSTLQTAWSDARILLGDNADRWAWGTMHQARFTHPLIHLADPELAEQMAMKPWPRGGGGFTTNNTGSYDARLEVNAGASYRQVIDVGNWDASTMTNAPGQSGDPRSPFYDNLLEGWATEQSFPLLFSREKILQHAEFRIELQPGTN